MKHNHRIIPGHKGGNYVEGNVISVEVTACDKQTANHVMWHYANWRLWEKAEDLLAWRGLAGFYSKEEVIEQKQKIGSKKGGEANVQSGHIKNLGETYGPIAMAPGGHLYENRVEYGKRGGAASMEMGVGIHSIGPEEKSIMAKKFYNEGKGLAVITEEERKINATKGAIALHTKYPDLISDRNKQKWVCPVCGYMNIARHVNKHMAEEHNLPKEAKQKVVG
jgi:hypothetical protein